MWWKAIWNVLLLAFTVYCGTLLTPDEMIWMIRGAAILVLVIMVLLVRAFLFTPLEQALEAQSSLQTTLLMLAVLMVALAGGVILKSSVLGGA
jgi:hypothetical protein